MEEPQKKNRDIRNITLSILAVLVLIAIVSGGTYAYFAFTVSNSTISGGAAKAEFSMTVTKMAPSSSNTTLVPQLTNKLSSAIIGTGGNKCVDGNGNTVCLIYKIELANATTAPFAYKLNFKIANGTSSSFANLMFAELPAASYSATDSSSIAAITGTSATTTDTQFKTGNLPVGNSTFYIIVWLFETGTTQNSTDFGTFTGTLTLFDNAGQAKLTSTFK